MVKLNGRSILKTAASVAFLTILLSCNTGSDENLSKTNTANDSANLERTQSIPDSVVRFLIHSAVKDFNEHRPPTAIDIRNVNAGYIPSKTDTVYLICGELLSKEENNWIQFVTIKTSGYEQYIGDNVYCQKATFEKTGNDRLADSIKQQLNAIKK